MQIIAHRGYWLKKSEQNTLAAFKRAVKFGFGIETDVRDYKGQLVIAHDIPSKQMLPAPKAFKVFSSMSTHQTLAINVKSCGQADAIRGLLKKYPVKNYFIFDAAVPDAVELHQKGLPVFTRQSEYEEFPSFLSLARGIWLDTFSSVWYNQRLIRDHLKKGKKVCVVSQELHGRACKKNWQMLKSVCKGSRRRLYLCTDFPLAAERFFHEKNKNNPV